MVVKSSRDRWDGHVGETMTQTDRETNKQLASVLLELFKILEDRKVDSEEGAQLCKACVVILRKIRGRIPKLWQRIAIDTVINILNEVHDYLMSLDRYKTHVTRDI